MKNSKRIWTKEELTIAYYIAKWDYNGLGIEEEDLVESVIGNTTVASLQFQVANFRHILGIEGFTKSDASKAMYKLVDDLANTTMTNVRKLVLAKIDKSETKIQKAKVTKVNKAANTRRDELNAESQRNFEAQMLLQRKLGRRLTPVVK